MGCVLDSAKREIVQQRSKLVKQGRTPGERLRIKNFMNGRIRNIESARNLTKKGFINPIIISVAAGVISAASLIKAQSKLPKISLKQRLIPITKAKKDQLPKDVVKEIQIQVPANTSRLDSLPKAAQTAVITTFLASVAGTKYVRRAGRVAKISNKPIPFSRGFLLKFMRRLKKRKFRFVSDMYSILFGIRAKPGEKIQLLKVGRVFTGLERRKLLR